jgi:multidrug efflux system membrane fusion protein
LTVTVSVTDQRGLGDLERSPVDVRHTSQRRENVLTVPVVALLALAEGGYGLEIVEDDGIRIVAVQTGLAVDGRIEVSGEGLAEGMTVGMPG